MITSTTDAIAIKGRRPRDDFPPEAERVAALEPPRPPEPEAAAALVAALRPAVASVLRLVVVSEALALVAAPDLKSVAALDPKLVAVPAPKLVHAADSLVRAAGSLVVPAADWVTQDGLPPDAERALVREVSWVDTPSREWESAM